MLYSISSIWVKSVIFPFLSYYFLFSLFIPLPPKVYNHYNIHKSLFVFIISVQILSFYLLFLSLTLSFSLSLCFSLFLFIFLFNSSFVLHFVNFSFFFTPSTDWLGYCPFKYLLLFSHHINHLWFIFIATEVIQVNGTYIINCTVLWDGTSIQVPLFSKFWLYLWICFCFWFWFWFWFWFCYL